MRLAPSFVAVWVLVAAGCVDEPVGTPQRGPPPDMVDIAGGPLEVGFHLGRLRQDAQVPPFRISKFPITNAHYRACVAAGWCGAPAMTTLACNERGFRWAAPPPDPGADADQPVVCVEPEQALRFCSWVGLRLPTDAEWLLAARGPRVQRFPWGDDPATCEEHLLGSPAPDEGTIGCGEPARDGPRVAGAFGAVGLHPAGASPSGVEDVLLTTAELVGAGAQSAFAVCKSEIGACLFRGVLPGAIDAVSGLPSRLTGQAGADSVALFGFRCAGGGS